MIAKNQYTQPSKSTVFTKVPVGILYSLSFWLDANPSSCISIINSVYKVLLFEPFPLLIGLGNINPLNFKDHRARAIITAGNHHALVICPLMHD